MKRANEAVNGFFRLSVWCGVVWRDLFESPQMAQMMHACVQGVYVVHLCVPATLAATRAIRSYL